MSIPFSKAFRSEENMAILVDHDRANAVFTELITHINQNG